jgi:5,5'-dehydrodivanillate O-demethylase
LRKVILPGFEEFEHGFTYRRVREGGSEDDDLWTVGRVCLWPNALFTTELR